MLKTILERLRHPSLHIAIRVVAVYLLVSLLWIFLSDRLIATLTLDIGLATRLQTYKGWAYVVVSAGVLFLLLAREQWGRYTAEQALDRSETGFDYLFAHNPSPMWVYDLETLAILTVNDAAVATYGYSREEFLKMTLKDIRPAEDVPRLIATMRESRPALRPMRIWHHRYKDGRLRTVRITSHKLTFSGRDAALVVIEDISEQEEAQASLREAEQQRRELETIIDRGPAVAFRWSDAPGWPVEFVSENVVQFGYEPADFLEGGMNYDAIIHPDDLAGVEDKFEGFLREGREEFFQEYRILDKSGGVRWVEERSWLRVPELGRSAGFQGIILGVDERREAEAKLRHSERRLADVIDFLPDPAFAVDAQGQVVMWNRAMEALSGVPAEEILGKGDRAYALPFYGERRPLLADLAIHPEQDFGAFYPQQVRFGEVLTVETYLPEYRGGTYIWARAAPLYDANGAINGAIEVVRDVTERRRREHDLEAMSGLAAALRNAHHLSDIYPIVLERVLGSLPAEGTWLARRDPLNGETLVELGLGSAARLTGRRTRPGEGVDGRVIASGQPAPLVGEGGVTAAPLIAQQQVIGALVVSRAAALTAHELRMLTGLADIAASAIHRALLFEQTQSQLNRLLALRSIDAAITASLDVRVTLNVLLDQVVAQLKIDAADVLLYDPVEHRLEYAAGRGFRAARMDHTRLRLGEGLPGKALQEGPIFHVADLNREGYPYLRQNLISGEGFVSYYGVPLVTRGEVKGVLELYHRSQHHATQDWIDFLQALATQAAIAIENASLFDHLQQANVELSLAYDATIEGWSRALELRDHETQGHALRVVDLTLRLARRLGVPEKDMIHLRRGVLLHDIGKMGIPDNILLKPGPLTEEEWAVMRRHPEYAYSLLAPIHHLAPALDIPYRHHERWDGSGYPGGLRGEQIPQAARMFAVVDVWDALLAKRPYRDAWPQEQVVAYLRASAGKTLDPHLVSAFLDMVTGDGAEGDVEPPPVPPPGAEDLRD